MTPLLAGFALGLASSAHCAAMCGPLVLAAARALTARSRGRHLAQLALHHTSRILVYALLAVPAGLAGETVAMRGFGRTVAVVAGAALLIAAFGSLRIRAFGRAGATVSAVVVRASTPVLRWSHRHSTLGPMLLGVLHGVLPCGLVYGALTTAAATSNVGSAVLLMTGFGAGTGVILLAISTGAAAVTPALRQRLRPLAPLVLAVTAAILIARGVLPGHQHVAVASAHAHTHE